MVVDAVADDAACDRIGDDGRCMAYEERPLVCRGYPWYDAPPRDIPLPDAECGYLVDLPKSGRRE